MCGTALAADVHAGRCQLWQHAITANCVAPGEIAIPMTDQEDEEPRVYGQRICAL